MKYFYTQIILIVFFLVSCSNKPISSETEDIVSITGELLESKDSSYVIFNRFFDENPQNYFFMFDSAKIVDKKFKKTFKVNHTSMITITPSKNVPKIYIICDPNSKINFTVRKEKKFIVTFEGDNAKGLQLFVESKLYNNTNLVSAIVKKIIPKSFATKDLILNIEKLKDSLMQPFDRLLLENEISPAFYKIAKVQGELKLVNAIHQALIFNLPDTTHMAECNVNLILRYLFKKYDPFSNRYEYANMVSRTTTASLKCRLINLKVLEGTRSEEKIWKGHLKYNEFAPMPLQEKMKAVSIMFNSFYGIYTYNEWNDEMALFNKTFPKSSFTTNLMKYKESAPFKDKTNNKDIIKNEYLFGIYNYKTEQLDSLTVYDNNNLDILIAKQFSGKAVLVDLWATWCGPCIKEFAYLDTLHPFLKKHNLEMLFVSLDNPSSVKKWGVDLNTYELEGYHFFATNNLNQYLKERLDIDVVGIPRYLLFDKNGNLVDDNLPRPSSGKELHDRIEELIK